MGKITFILGGARSGKSSYAERLAAESGLNVLYIATAQALDQEMAIRIKKHQETRPKHWQTMEIPADIQGHINGSQVDVDVLILDCLTLLVSNILMTLPDYEEDVDEEFASQLVAAEITTLISTIQASQAHWIIVSNEVGMGLVPPYPLGRVYRDQLGWANRKVAGIAEKVIFMIAGLPWTLKPLND